jgi:hypothetical protein
MINEILDYKHDPYVGEKEKIALNEFSQLSNESKSKNRRYFIRPMRISGFTLAETKNLGFKCSKHLWKSCLLFTPKQKNGRKPLKQCYQQNINSFFESLSSTSSDRIVKIKDQDGNKIDEIVRYIDTSFHEAYLNYGAKHQMCESTFRKYISKIYKKPYRWTVCCNFISFKFLIIVSCPFSLHSFFHLISDFDFKQ